MQYTIEYWSSYTRCGYQQSLEVIEVHCKVDAVLNCSIHTLEQSATVSQVQQYIQDNLGVINTTVDRVEGRLELVGTDQVDATDKSKQAIMKELSVIAGALEERIQSVGNATEWVGATIKESELSVIQPHNSSQCADDTTKPKTVYPDPRSDENSFHLDFGGH